ncbi:hypothetical protein RJ640_028034, partial [Escallonia rubra]
QRVSLLRTLGSRRFSVPAATVAAPAPAPAPEAAAELLLKRNYANNESEYNTVIGSITAKRRHYLLRDVYDDMVLDGVKPERDTFHSLIIGTMKGARMQDALFFRDEMKAMGLVPDVALYNFLISTCGKCKNSDLATRILEEMKKFEVKPTGQTFICLLNAYAASGRLDRVYAIVRDMTAAGLGLNKFCYAGLITAHRNKTPVTGDTAKKIIELVEQSKGWSSVEEAKNIAENFMKGISEEELYSLPTAEYVHRRFGFLNRQLTVYHVAFHACADLRDIQAIEMLLEMLNRDKQTPDTFILIQMMRCYLHSGDLDRGYQIYEDYMKKKPPVVELYATFIEGAMVGYTPKGTQLAQDALTNMTSRNFFLSPKMGSDLLLQASGERTGGFATANMIWDTMQARKIVPTLPAVEAYYNGLKGREIPEDDPRLMLVSRTVDNLRRRFGRS